MHFIPPDIIRCLMVAIFCLFIVLSGFLLPMYLKNIRVQDLTRAKNVFASLGPTKAFRQAEDNADNFRVLDYIVPVGFTTILVLVFSIIVFFGSRYNFGDKKLFDYLLGAGEYYETGFGT